MDFKEAIGAIVAGVVLLLPAVKWLISDWAKKAEEIEKLKSLHAKTVLSRLEDDVKDFRSAIDSIQVTIRSLEVNLSSNRSGLEELKVQLKEAVKHIDQYSRDFDNKIKNTIKTEIVELSKRAALIRAKKDG